MVMKYKIMIVFALAVLCSCNRWLDITPEDTTTEKQLFSDAGGYHSAINGLYQTLSSSALYGENLTWGYLSALSQYYNNTSANNSKKFSYTEQYDYASSEVKAFGEEIWQTGYNVVANANNILRHLESADPGIFPDRESGEMDMIRGEALAVRALVQFDILRLFAVAPSVDPGAKAIPYVKEYPALFSERKTVKEVLDCVKEDLSEAAELLAVVDTLNLSYNISSTSNRYSAVNSSLNYFFTARGVRMNYVGTMALLARVYAYEGSLDKAYAVAKKIDDKYISIIDAPYKYTSGFSDSDTEANRPHKLMDELLISFYYENLATNYTSAVSKTMDYNAYALKNISGIFADNDDYRQRKLISSLNLDIKVSMKYLERSGNSSLVSAENKVLPVMRLSELHLIMAEYLAESGKLKEAAAMLNRLRIARGCMGNPVAEDVSYSEFMNILGLEVCRENVAEGQYFFWCKRRNLPVINNNGVYVQMDGKYTMLIPDSETSLN